MLKIDKEESGDDSDRAANKSATNTPRKVEPAAEPNDQNHVNNVNSSMPTNAEVPLQSLPKVSRNFTPRFRRDPEVIAEFAPPQNTMNHSAPPRTPASKPVASIRSSAQKSQRKPSRNNKRSKKKHLSSSEEEESDFSDDDYE